MSLSPLRYAVAISKDEDIHITGILLFTECSTILLLWSYQGVDSGNSYKKSLKLCVIQDHQCSKIVARFWKTEQVVKCEINRIFVFPAINFVILIST